MKFNLLVIWTVAALAIFACGGSPEPGFLTNNYSTNRAIELSNATEKCRQGYPGFDEMLEAEDVKFASIMCSLKFLDGTTKTLAVGKDKGNPLVDYSFEIYSRLTKKCEDSNPIVKGRVYGRDEEFLLPNKSTTTLCVILNPDGSASGEGYYLQN